MYLRFHFYYSGMVKQEGDGKEMIAIEKIIYYAQSPRGECISCHIMQDHTEMNWDWSGGRRREGKALVRVFIVVDMEEMDEIG